MSIIEDRFQWTTATRRIGMSLCGFLLIVLPNSITLFIQTGHGPLTQYFRMGTYTVTVDDPEILENIEKIKRGEVKEYRDIYEQRRQLFRLLPDASEMYSSILSKKNSRPGIWEKIKKNLLDPKAYLLRLKKNFLHIKYAIGDPLFFVFLAMMLTPFLVRRSRTEFPKRYSIGGFVLFYILAISTLSDLVPRYVEVLLPFVLIHTACELYVIATNLFHRYGHRTADILCGVAVLLLVLLSTPSYFTQLTLHQRIPEHAMLRVTLQNSLRSNHGIFSLHPAWSYLLGGKWRVLPNDRFEKVVEYARRTGVNWLLVSKTANDVGEIRLYTEAQWYENPYLPFRYPELVEYYGGDQRGQFRLYRILNHEDLS
jgi:hypothetical protein